MLNKRHPEIVNDYISMSDAVNMYRRFSEEAINVFSKYPYMKEVLK
jgi:hypothetical protein